MNQLVIFQNNINGFSSKADLLDQNLQSVQPHICLLQECFRSERRSTTVNYFQMYKQFWSQTGRTGILCRCDFTYTQNISTETNKTCIKLQDMNRVGLKSASQEKENQ